MYVDVMLLRINYLQLFPDQRVRVAIKNGFWVLKIPKYESQNVTFPIQIDLFLQCNEKFVQFLSLAFILVLKLGWWQLYLHIVSGGPEKIPIFENS